MKEEEQQKKEIKNSVLAAISNGEVTMRPRWHFVLKAALLVTGIFILFFVLLYLTSFILFALRQNGLLFTPAFGLRGWVALLKSLPWLLIGFTILFVILLEILVQRYAVAYREPLLYSVVGIVVVVVAGGFIIFKTPLHRSLLDSAAKGNLPLIGEFYRGFGMEHLENVHPGFVIATATTGFVIQEPFPDATETILVSSDTDFPDGRNIMLGENVVVFGDEASGEIVNAMGVHLLGNYDKSFFGPPCCAVQP